MNEREIFAAALEQPTEAERQAFLNDLCDPEMRQRIERLIQEQAQLGSFLDHPPVDAMTADKDTSGGRVAPTVVYENGSTQNDEGEATIPGQTMKQNPQQQDDEIPVGYLQPSTKPNSLGRLGHYEIIEVIGHGGFGTVLRAFDEKLHRVVAVKVLAPEIAATSPARRRFLREARTSAQIRHENVVYIHAVEDDPTPYLVMEFIPGKTLQQRLDERGPLDLPDVLRLGKQIADGLSAAHERGLIHRDIKPANILLEGGMHERVKITDFGLARTADDASMTQSGVIAGTPMYMAPEQADGRKLDQRADLFSFGSVLYQMVSGRPPFRAPTTLAVLRRVTEDSPRPIQEIIPEAPGWMCQLIGHLHAKNPDDRYESAREVSELLAQCAEDLQAGRIPKIPDPSETFEESSVDVTEVKPRRSPGGIFSGIGRIIVIVALVVAPLTWGLIHLLWASPAGTAKIAINAALLDGSYEFFVDGTSQDVAQLQAAGLSVGAHEIEVRKDGKVVAKIVIDVSEDEAPTVHITIRDGKVIVSTETPSPTISKTPAKGLKTAVNDSRPSTARAEGLDLKAGSYKGIALGAALNAARKNLETQGLKYDERPYGNGGKVLSLPGEVSYRFTKSGTLNQIFALGKQIQISGRLKLQSSTIEAFEQFLGARATKKPAPIGQGILHAVVVGPVEIHLIPMRGDPETVFSVMLTAAEDQAAASSRQNDFALLFKGWVFDSEKKRYTQYSMASIPRLTFGDATTLTVEAFIRPTIGQGDPEYKRRFPNSPIGVIYLRSSQPRGSMLGLRMQFQGDHLRWRLGYGLSRATVDSISKVRGDDWCHLAFTIEKNVARLFVDGVLQPGIVELGGEDPQFTMLEFGLLGTTAPKYGVTGLVDEVRISDVVRYSEDFKVSRYFKPDDHTVALFHCDEGDGNVLKDSSGNKHRGLLRESSWVKADAR